MANAVACMSSGGRSLSRYIKPTVPRVRIPRAMGGWHPSTRGWSDEIEIYGLSSTRYNNESGVVNSIRSSPNYFLGLCGVLFESCRVTLCRQCKFPTKTVVEVGKDDSDLFGRFSHTTASSNTSE